MKSKTKQLGISAAAIVLLVLADQWTKYMVAARMKLHESIEIIKDFFYLTYVQNTGAGFSIFEGYGKVFFALLTILALTAIVYYYFHTKDQKVRWCLVVIFAGAIGNFIDRMTLGYVVDFFSFYFFGWGFPVFNIADICISIGFVMLIIFTLIDEYKEQQRWKNKK